LTLTSGSIVVGDGCYIGQTHRDITLDNENHKKQTTILTLEEGGKIERRFVEARNGAEVYQKGGELNTTALKLIGGGVFNFIAGSLNTGKPGINSGGYVNFPTGSKGVWTIQADKIKLAEIMMHFPKGSIRVNDQVSSAEAFKVTEVSPTQFTIQLAQ